MGLKNLKTRREWDSIKKRYPFLEQRVDPCTGKEIPPPERRKHPPLLTKDAHDIPPGWVECFGEELCKELKEDFLKNGCLDSTYILESKEKYGELHLVLDGTPYGSQAERIISNYATISASCCTGCGRLDSPMVDLHGWTVPMCRGCYEKSQRNAKIKQEKSYDDTVIDKNKDNWRAQSHTKS